MDDQLEQAVEIAIRGDGDPGLKQQAIDFCQQVKNSPDGWQLCLSIFTGDIKRSETTRFFSLQVVEDSLGRLSPGEVLTVRDQLFAYHRRSTASPVDSIEPAHMRNKVAQIFSYLFVLCYSESWVTFFDDLMALMYDGDSDRPNSVAIDMYLRVLRAIHEEVGDNLIARSRELTDRNNVLKDLVRQRCVAKLAASWRTILQQYDARPDLPLQRDVVDGALKVVGTWATWIDLSLVAGPEYLTLIHKQLSNPQQRMAACDSLLEIVLKKMKPAEKLELVAMLNPTNLIMQLLPGQSTVNANEASNGPNTAGSLEFDERVAKLANAMVVELVHIVDGTTSETSGAPVSDQDAVQALSLVVEMVPVVLEILSNEYDDTSAQVIPALADYLSLVRKQVRTAKQNMDTTGLSKNKFGQFINFPPDSTFIDATTSKTLSLILHRVMMKMRYDNDAVWTSDQDDDEVLEFTEFRGRLKVLQESIAGTDEVLYTDGMAYVIEQSLGNSNDKKWQDVELGLYELMCLGESLKNNTMTVTRGVESYATKKLHQLLAFTISSNVVSVNHPSVQLWYIELVHRHSNFLTSGSQPDLLRKVLEVFVSPLGIHNQDKRVQARSWYLFSRFIRATRAMVGEIAEQIFNSVSPLLTIRAEVPPDAKLNDDDSDVSVAASGDDFENQLYLFELCGVLFYATPEDQQSYKLTQRLLQPLYGEIESNLQKNYNQDQQVVMQIHHCLMAIATVARGFDDSNRNSHSMTVSKPGADSKPALQEFKNAAEATLVVVERIGHLEVVREAARASCSALIPLLGVQILPEITRMISGFLMHSRAGEFADFFSFLGQLMFSFRTETGVFEMFNSLLTPLVDRLLVLMKKAEEDAATESTDAQVLRKYLRRSYLQFIFNTLNNGMGAIFITKDNRAAFESVMASILHYAGDLTDTQSQKAAVLVLSKMLAVWGDGVVQADPLSGPAMAQVFGKGMKVEAFSDAFIFKQYSPVCWELAGRPGFNLRDAQTRLVLADLATLQKTLYERKGQAYCMYLVSQYLPSLGLPPTLAQEYVENLAALSVKDFKKYYIDFLGRLA